MATLDNAGSAGPARFKIYAITGRGAGELVRWTDTKLKKDHNERVDQVLYRCENGFRGYTKEDAVAFREARERFLEGRGKGAAKHR